MRRRVASLLAGVATLGLVSAASALTIELPAPNPFNSATRGAFSVFSIPIIVDLTGGIVVDGKVEKSIGSAPGLIQDELVLYTGPGEKGDVPGELGDNNSTVQICGSSTNDCVDSPFPSPAGNLSPTFGTDQSADPDPDFTANGDRSNPVVNEVSGNTWDVTLAALDNFLTGANVPIFLFQHSQDSGGDAADQDVLGWAQVILSDINGSGPGGANLPDLCFNFNNNTTQSATACTQPQAFVSRAPDPENPVAGGPQGDFVFAAGQVCLDANGDNVACDGSQVLGPINHNLGANEFAYAILSFDLNTFLGTCFANLVTCGYDVMRVDFRLRELTGGFEQLIIAQGVVAAVPLPASLTLLAGGLGIGSLGAIAWKRRLQR